MNITRWRDAAVLVSLSIGLVAQRIRFESYESEKTGLLLLLGAVMVAASLAASRPIWRHPILLAVGGLLLWALVSTIFALTPSLSFWGGSYRAQGWLALLAGFILMWSASQLSDSARAQIPPLLCLIAIPMCLLVWVSRLGLDPALPQLDRPVSLAGNVNFLDDWLVMILILIAPLLVAPRRLRLLGLATAVLMLATLFMTEGRAALLSLSAAAIFALLVWSAIHRRRGLLMGVVLCLMIGSILYAVGGSIGVRLFTLDDPARTAMWKDGLSLIGQMTIPFTDAHQTPDSSAALRPLLGYGLDNLEQTHPRLTESPYYFSSWIDRFHNQMLDTILSLGWPGLLLHFGVYLAALFTGLRALGLLPTHRAGMGLFISLVLGCLIGLGLAAFVQVELAPVGAGLGGFFGLSGWLTWKAFTAQGVGEGHRPSPTEKSPNIIILVTLLALIIQQWIANQFGFTQTLSQTLWWVALGLLIRETGNSVFPVNQAQMNNDKGGLAIIPGLFLIHSLGTFPLGLQYAGLPTLLGVALVTVALGGWTLGMDKRGWMVLLICGLTVTLLRSISAGLLGQGTGISLVLGAGLLAMSGLLMVVVAVLWLVRKLPENNDFPLSLSRWRWLLLTVCLLIGVLLYVVPYTGAALHRIGDTLAADGKTAAALYSLDLALLYTPVDSRVYLSRAHVHLSTNTPSGLEAARQELNRLFQDAPFMANTRNVYDLRPVLRE